MAKPKKNKATSINLNAKKIKIGGDVVGGDKIVYEWRDHVDLDEANKLVTEIRKQIDEMQEVDQSHKAKLQEMAGEIHNDLKSTTPNAENILEKLKTFQNTLITVQGIGTAGLGLYTLIETLGKLFVR